MAKVLLVSINDFVAGGLRVLSSCLRRNGHEPHIVFVQKYDFLFTTAETEGRLEQGDWIGIDENAHPFRYACGPDITERETGLLIDLIGRINPGLVGFSVTTPLLKKAGALTKTLKSAFPSIPVLWGGPAPTLDPKACLAHADFVCIGEGEQTIVDAASEVDRGGSIGAVRNIARLENGRLIINALYPPVADLNALPFKDISPLNKYLIDEGRLTPDFGETGFHPWTYQLTTSRGCPFSCTYCSENYYRKLYAPHPFLRRRSAENVIEELKLAIKATGCGGIQFEDDIFSMDYPWLRRFAELYITEIHLPVTCYIYPNASYMKTLTLLRDMGVTMICLALQSGSHRINREIFGRTFNRDIFLSTAAAIKALGMSFYTDVITFNPFETEEDLFSTLSVLTELPQPYILCVNKLYPMANTEMGHMYEACGRWLTDEKTYHFYSRLFWMASQHDLRGTPLYEMLSKKFPHKKRTTPDHWHSQGDSPA